MKTNQEFKNLPEVCKQWLIENDWEEGARVFLSNAGVPMIKGESKSRERALILAILWYNFHQEQDNDPRSIPSDIQHELKQFFKLGRNEEVEDYESRIRDLWLGMCQHAAEYKYAKIESEHLFHRALWGSFRILMDEDLIMETVDIPIENAIKFGFYQIYPETVTEISYGIKLNGLDSTLVFIPSGAQSWVDHADMYLRLVRVSQ